MSSRVANHLHRYKKVNLSRQRGKEYFVYRCMKPACSHYVPITIAEGKLCECNRCGEPMIIGKTQLYGSHGEAMTKPHCSNCVERKVVDADKAAAIAAFLEDKS